MLNLKSITGVPFNITFDIDIKAIDNIGHADGWNINLGRQILKKENISFVIKGLRASDVVFYDKDHCGYAPSDVIKTIKNGAAAALCGKVNANKFVVIGLDAANANAYATAYKAAKEAGTTAEAADLMEAQQQMAKAEAVAELEDILEKAKTSAKNADGSLFTEAQKKKYLKDYNNLYNQGGEGYLPEVITQEAVEHFRNKAQKYNN